MATPAARAAAVAFIEECRAIHVGWAEWQDGLLAQGRDWVFYVSPTKVGGPEWHRGWVEKYDLVLAVLSGADGD